VRAGGTPEERAPLYLAFFGGQGAEVYFSRDIGGMALLLMLDSSHVVPHTGPQLEWLGAELAANEDAPYKIAVYHKQLYPSHHAFDGDDATQGRAYWQPLFDQYGLDIAFEHHGHASKRTVPLRGGEPDPAGTVYLGEGGWGVEPRRPDVDRGYLEQAAQRRHFWVVDVSPQALNCRAADEQGQVFDAYSVHPRAR
jgi:hypothetical protein